MDYLSLMNAVSDTVGIPLHLDPQGTVSSKLQPTYKPLKGLSVSLPMDAKVLFLSKESGGVLFHVVGDLYVMVAQKFSNRVISLYMVNADKMLHKPEAVLGKSFDLPMAYKALKEGVVFCAVWKQTTKESGWIEFNP